MFTKKRSSNLKIVFMTFLMAVFIISGLFINTRKSEAVESVRYATVSYSLSEVVSTANNVGGMTTTVLIGCAPGSKDVYDINTGKPCLKFTKTVLVGCAPLSGDLYDINTGKQCTNAPVAVLAGCKAGSGDIYDTGTGKKCTNDTSIKPKATVSMASANQTQTNVIAKIEPKKTETPINTPTEKLVAQVMEINQIDSEPIEEMSKDDDVSGREKIKDSLVASAGRVGSIFEGPMSIWIILLIVIILIGGGYGAYSFLKKDDEVKDEIKKNSAPIAPKANNAAQQNIPIPIPTTPVIKETVKSESVNAVPQTTPIDYGNTKTSESNPTNSK